MVKVVASKIGILQNEHLQKAIFIFDQPKSWLVWRCKVIFQLSLSRVTAYAHAHTHTHTAAHFITFTLSLCWGMCVYGHLCCRGMYMREREREREREMQQDTGLFSLDSTFSAEMFTIQLKVCQKFVIYRIITTPSLSYAHCAWAMY